jgi:hypothetical protein
VERYGGWYGALMSAVLRKLRTFGVLLILAAGVVLAGTAFAAADGVPFPTGDEIHRAVADSTSPIEKACVSASPKAECSTCCHDMESSLCCGHFVALGTETKAGPSVVRHFVTNGWVPVAMYDAHPEVGKRPPRHAV